MALPEWLQEIINFFKKDYKVSSSKIAKERLQLVIVQDRNQTNNKTIEKLKEDLINVISKYNDVDVESMDFQIKTHDKKIALVASISFKASKKNN
jgi:cell division topological specificity factor